MIRKHLYYRGNVQGVGFRYTAIRIASNHRITGYVRNMRDGRVEIVVEGDPKEVARFVGAVAEEMAGFIREVSVQDEPYSGTFSRFDLSY